MSIQPLPEEVIAQIKSSTAITSLNGVVVELMKNSLDAGSTKVDISVDYSRGGCVLEDDGLGILPSEFGENGGLGKLYHSSKLNSQTPIHGGRGTFLASLSAMSLLSITSHHHQHRSYNTLSMHKSEVVSRLVPAPAQQYLSHFDHGTRVTVRNLFGNMPVRVKQRAIATEKQGTSMKDWESLKRNVVLLCLAWPSSVAVALRELSSNQRMAIRGSTKVGPGTEIHRVCDILSQSSLITPEEKTSWVAVGASTSALEVSGTISLDPSPTKLTQFVSFDIQPIQALEGQSILHDEINRLFLNSAFGSDEEGEALDDAESNRRAKDARYKRDGYTNKELKGGRKGVDRWPMFYINIQRTRSSHVTEKLDVDYILDDKANSLTAIIDLLHAMIFEFLTRHHFSPKAYRGQRSKGTKEWQDTSNQENSQSPHNRKTATFAKSPSENATLIKKVKTNQPVKIRSSNSDLLGTNIKIPSFRQSSTDSPFDGWSRIKSGTARPALYRPIGLLPGDEIERPATAPPPSLCPVIRSTLPPSSTPLISLTGKVTRRPFEDVPTRSGRPKSIPPQTIQARSFQAGPATTQPPTPINLTEDADDDILTWINPITNVKSIVNKRTGHTVPATHKKTTPSVIRSLSSPNLSSRPKLKTSIPSAPSQPGPWISNLLQKWDNPVFRPTEPAIPQVTLHGETEHIRYGHRHNCTQLDISRAFIEASSGINGRISKSALGNAEVIGQVDRKFILVKLLSSGGGEMLGIVDQHAADERIRVEGLLSELCTAAPPRGDGMPSESGLATTYLEKGVAFDVSEKDIELLRTKKAHFAAWGICYDLHSPTTKPRHQNGKTTAKQKFTVRTLPPSILERCKADPKILIDLIRAELYSNSKASSHTASITNAAQDGKEWLTRIHNCPQGILDMINSRACRSAIMFNDVLSKEQCEVLMKRLAGTAFPFQCAHGRPSLLPLVELGSVPASSVEGSGCDMIEKETGFRRQFGKWKTELGK